MHSDPVYLSTQLYIYTSAPCVLTNIKAYMKVLCLKHLSKNEKKKNWGTNKAHYFYGFKS